MSVLSLVAPGSHLWLFKESLGFSVAPATFLGVRLGATMWHPK